MSIYLLPFWVLMNKAAARILVHTFSGAYAVMSLGYVTESGNAELSQGRHGFHFNRHREIEWLCHWLVLPVVRESSSCPVSSYLASYVCSVSVSWWLCSDVLL